MIVTPATPGQEGFIQYAFEQVGMMTFGGSLPAAYFWVSLEDGRPFAGFQVYWGHAPEGIAGLASIAFHSIPGHGGWHGYFRGRHPGVEALRALIDALPLQIHRLEVVPRANDRASCAALERAGFKLEGILKKWYPYQGDMVDSAMYSWVREGDGKCQQ